MKKVLLTAFAVLTVFVASAQIEKGTWLVSGNSNLNFTSFNEDAGDYSQFSLGVKGGYFLMDNLAVGLNIGFNKIEEASQTSIGLFGRYYVNGSIFAGVGFNSNSLDSGIEGADKVSYSTIPVEVGYAIFIGNVVAIEPAVNYTIYGGDAEGAAFGLNVGISVYLGRGN